MSLNNPEYLLWCHLHAQNIPEILIELICALAEVGYL